MMHIRLLTGTVLNYVLPWSISFSFRNINSKSINTGEDFLCCVLLFRGHSSCGFILFV